MKSIKQKKRIALVIIVIAIAVATICYSVIFSDLTKENEEYLETEKVGEEQNESSESIILEFLGEHCNPESVDPRNESQLGIKEITWLDNSTVFIQANVSINCAFWIEGGGFYVHNNTITLTYYIGQEGFKTEEGLEGLVMANCICATGLSFTLSNLNSTDFVFELESSSRTYYN